VSPSERASSPNPQMTGFASLMPPPFASAVGNGPAQMVAQQPSVDQAPLQQPKSTDWAAPGPTNWPPPPPLAVPADGAPAAESGPIPLPRERPRPVMLADAAIPLPQPRPDAASAGEPAAPAGAADWLRGIFQSSPPAAPEPQPVHPGDY
jgi:hypothetical protein